MSNVPPGRYSIDVSHSVVSFTVRHAGISKVRGTFDKFDGEIIVADRPSASSVNVTIDSGSINTGSAKRDNHLRSADFWDSENKPTWTFNSTSVEAPGDPSEGFVLRGDLRINNVTRPVELRAEYNGAGTDPFGLARIGFSATTEVSREDFKLTWNATMETGGILVGDRVKIELEVEATKQD
jgi:polyisoprenoid-binding protein YceI